MLYLVWLDKKGNLRFVSNYPKKPFRGRLKRLGKFERSPCSFETNRVMPGKITRGQAVPTDITLYCLPLLCHHIPMK